MLVIGDKMAGNIWEDLGLGKSEDQPKADLLHDDKTVGIVELFTEFIKRAIKDIDAGKSLDIQEQQRVNKVDAVELLAKLYYNPDLMKFIDLPDEVIKNLPEKMDELLSQSGRGKQLDGTRITYKQPNLLNKPLKGLFTYLTEQKYSVDDQVKYVMQVYADCKYRDYHLIEFDYMNATDSLFDDHLEIDEEFDKEEFDKEEYVDYRNKYEAIRQVRTKLLS